MATIAVTSNLRNKTVTVYSSGFLYYNIRNNFVIYKITPLFCTTLVFFSSLGHSRWNSYIQLQHFFSLGTARLPSYLAWLVVLLTGSAHRWLLLPVLSNLELRYPRSRSDHKWNPCLDRTLRLVYTTDIRNVWLRSRSQERLLVIPIRSCRMTSPICQICGSM